MPRRSLVAALLVAITSLGLAAVPGLPSPAAAAEYTMDTAASYTVDPDAGTIEVRVTVTFTNTTPDPDGQFSLFDEVKLAVHDAARDARAGDRDGDLDVAVEVENGVNVATVALREGLRYEDTAKFTLVYELADSDDPQLRVRPSVVVFPAWSFGTSGEVRIAIPPGYEVRVDGDGLTEAGGAFVSGAIEDPSRWLALVTAVEPAEYTTFDATVPLGGGTADLSVRAFADDQAWGEATRDLVSAALPLIEAETGLPYPRIGQLVITEAVASDSTGFGEGGQSSTEIVVAFDQPDFTVLHQVAHVWLSDTFVTSRWLREGLASHVAARVAAELDVDLPYDPAERAADANDAAFRLDAWPAGGDSRTETYGYARSWSFLDQVADAVGDDAIRAVLARVAGSIGSYQPATVEPDIPVDGAATPALPLTTRSFLDHLETVTGTDLGELFAARVLTEEDVALLPDRAAARASFAELEAAAGTWGVPDPLAGALTAWEFPTVIEQAEVAAAWLDERDALLDDMRAAGLSAPDRLQQVYRSHGGGAEAVAEIVAERSVVERYAATAAQVNAERSFLERLGLIGGADPQVPLNLANGQFADGNLHDAVDSIGEAERIVASAATSGIVRIASALLLALLVLGVAVLLVRRRSSYTAPR
jgi:hypothetical protein